MNNKFGNYILHTCVCRVVVDILFNSSISQYHSKPNGNISIGFTTEVGVWVKRAKPMHEKD